MLKSYVKRIRVSNQNKQVERVSIMPAIQELVLQSPEMMNPHFHVEKTGNEYQKWEQSFLGGEEIEFYLEERQTWIKAKVHRVYIDDGSGNAPGCDAHFYLIWDDEQGSWKYVMHAGVKVRFDAPTDEELIAASGWCEGSDWTGGYYEPATAVPCSKHGKKYVAPSGQKCWYCDQHRPDWAKLAE